MSDNVNPVSTNTQAWLTPDMLRRFLLDRNVKTACELCAADNWYIDTGETGYIPRDSAYSNNPDGTVNTFGGLHMPTVRTVCTNCGHIRHHATFVIYNWQATFRVPSQPLGGQ